MTSPLPGPPQLRDRVPVSVVALQALGWMQTAGCALLAGSGALLLAASIQMRSDPESALDFLPFFVTGGWTGLLAGTVAALALGLPLTRMRAGHRGGAQGPLRTLVAVETVLGVGLLVLAGIGLTAWGLTTALVTLLLGAGPTLVVALAVLPSSREWARGSRRAD